MITKMSLFSVNESAARTKQTARSVPLTRDDLVNTIRAELYGGGEQAGGSAAAGAKLDANINDLLSLTGVTDVIMESDNSDGDDQDSGSALIANIAKLMVKNAEKSHKKQKHEDSLQKDNEDLKRLIHLQKKKTGDEDTEDVINLIRSKIAASKNKIKGYKTDLGVIDNLLKKVVRTEIVKYSKKAHHTQINSHSVHAHLGAILNDYSIPVKYTDLVDELVKKEYTKKIGKILADQDKENKKSIKDLMNSHFKIANLEDISLRRSMHQLKLALTHIPEESWQTKGYEDFVHELITEHQSKAKTKTIKVLQNSIDKGMKQQLRDLVVQFAKKTDVEKITKSLCKAYLVAEVKDDCGDISRYDDHINDVMRDEIKNKIGKQLLAMNKVMEKDTRKRIRADIVTYFKDFDIFNPTEIILPDRITFDEREVHDKLIKKTIFQEIHSKARKLVRQCVGSYMKTITDTDMNNIDLEVVKAYVIKSFHSTDAAERIVNQEQSYICNVIFNENVKQVKNVITSLLVEYMTKSDKNSISEKSCIHHVFDFFGNHHDGGKSIRENHHQFIRKTIDQIYNKTMNTGILSSEEEEEEENEVDEMEESSSGEESD